MKSSKTAIREDHQEQKAEFLKAMAQATRLKILDFLRDGERCVCEIFPAIGEKQSNVSRHLQFMKRAQVLASRKDGVRVMYRIRNENVQRLLAQADAVFEDARSPGGSGRA